MQDKIVTTIKFLQEYGEIEPELSLKEVYQKYLAPDVLPLDDKATWENIQKNNILNIFQFDSQVGSQAVQKVKPENILELSDANALMRLMTGEEGGIQPLEKYIWFKNDPTAWKDEMIEEGLTEAEQEVIKPYFAPSYGVPPMQEQLMQMLMDENICGFTLAEANEARKIVGKKKMDKIPALREKVLKQAKSAALGHYIWTYGAGPQMGYSFSSIHSLAYSYIGFQTAYLATKWDPIYWNTACLIVNSSGAALEDEEEDIYDDIPDITEDDLDLMVQKNSVKKGTDYVKTAKALGEIISQGIKVSLIDINRSAYNFKPDKENQTILFGMQALNGVGEDIVVDIINNRPYVSFKDFLQRTSAKKTAIITLIKAGAFDKLEKGKWNDKDDVDLRRKLMVYYISLVSEPKSRITLQNYKGLSRAGLIPEQLAFENTVFYFNQYLREHSDDEYHYIEGEGGILFYTEHFNSSFVSQCDRGLKISKKDWKKMYDSVMDNVRNWMKANEQELLFKYNCILFKEQWEKYALGTISAWEMEALCFYYHDHELSSIDNTLYNIVNFNELSKEPIVEKMLHFGGKDVPTYELSRIAGTVVGKDKTKYIVYLLTTDGVVNVKFTKDYFAMFDRQISEVMEDGHKKVREKSWFERGSMIMVLGFRRDDTFVGKKYARYNSHQLYKIEKVLSNGEIEMRNARWGETENER